QGSDAQGFWDWKDAYEACEAAQLLFLRRFGSALMRQSSAAQLAMISKIAGLLPSQTRRSLESEALQQFSTPIPVAWIAARAAGLGAGDLVLEPSAGTGLLAIFAEIAGAELALNELGDGRAELLGRLFPATPVSRFDAAHIHDHLDAAVIPTVVLMNPPFSAGAHVEGRVADAALRHIASALARLADGGRLVAITGAGLSPHNPAWRDAFSRLQQRGRILFSAVIAGSVYARHGTTTETRLTIIDRTPAEDPDRFPDSPGMAANAAQLLTWVDAHVPPRAVVTPAHPTRRLCPKPALHRAASAARRPAPPPAQTSGRPLGYTVCDWSPPVGDRLTEALYEPYVLQSIAIEDAKPHPTPLVQSASMASVCPPKPRYVPLLPDGLVAAGLLSDAQLETVIYAGETHDGHLAGAWSVDATFDQVSAAADDTEGAVRFRRGFMLGDGTGAGKGRQVAGIILDNWLKGRRRAVWVSKSDALIEDAQRDWSALGQEGLLVTPLSRFRQGAPIRLDEGILFATYATLRSD
ncbi:MAG: methylase, partial [Azorhizobium sp. 32-67-21]